MSIIRATSSRARAILALDAVAERGRVLVMLLSLIWKEEGINIRLGRTRSNESFACGSPNAKSSPSYFYAILWRFRSRKVQGFAVGIDSEHFCPGTCSLDDHRHSAGSTTEIKDPKVIFNVSLPDEGSFESVFPSCQTDDGIVEPCQPAVPQGRYVGT